MNALVDLIKKIGIFMIAAQAVIHFAPAQKYEKYMKLIVGILILLQFLMPVYHIFMGTEWDWEEVAFDAKSAFGLQEAGEMTPNEMAGSASLADTVLKNMEEEIKSKLNGVISGQNYSVSGVKVSMRTLGDKDANGILQYEIDRVRVVVRRTYSMDGVLEKDGADKIDEMESIEKVQIEKIAIGSDAMKNAEEEETILDSKEEKEKELRDIFCKALGMEEEKLEVIVYGMDEENTG